MQPISGVKFAAELSADVQEALSKLRHTEALLSQHSTDDSSGMRCAVLYHVVLC